MVRYLSTSNSFLRTQAKICALFATDSAQFVPLLLSMDCGNNDLIDHRVEFTRQHLPSIPTIHDELDEPVIIQGQEKDEKEGETEEAFEH